MEQNSKEVMPASVRYGFGDVADGGEIALRLGLDIDSLAPLKLGFATISGRGRAMLSAARIPLKLVLRHEGKAMKRNLEREQEMKKDQGIKSS